MRKYRWLIMVSGVLVLGAALVFGAAFGAGLTYFFFQKAQPVQAAFATHRVPTTPEDGVLISAVEPGSAAEAAGLVRGDILLEINGQAVNNLMDLKSILAQAAPSDRVSLTVQHGDETRTLTADLGDLDGAAYLGVNTCGGSLGDGMFNTPMGDVKLEIVNPGAEITEVLADSPAEAAGLQIGDVILSVDGENVDLKTGLADLIQEHAPGDKVTLEIQPAGETAPREVTLTLGENPDNPDQAYLGVGFQMSMSSDALPHYYFHNFNGEDSQGQLPEEGWDQNGQMPFHGMPFMDPSQLPDHFEGAVIVSEVLTDTPASEAGLQPGDLILAVDGETVTQVDTFVEIMQGHQPGDQVTLTVFRAGEQLEITATLAAHPDNPTFGYLGVMAGDFILNQMQAPAAPGTDSQFELPGVPGGDA